MLPKPINPPQDYNRAYTGLCITFLLTSCVCYYQYAFSRGAAWVQLYRGKLCALHPVCKKQKLAHCKHTLRTRVYYTQYITTREVRFCGGLYRPARIIWVAYSLYGLGFVYCKVTTFTGKVHPFL